MALISCFVCFLVLLFKESTGLLISCGCFWHSEAMKGSQYFPLGNVFL